MLNVASSFVLKFLVHCNALPVTRFERLATTAVESMRLSAHDSVNAALAKTMRRVQIEHQSATSTNLSVEPVKPTANVPTEDCSA